MTDDLAAVKDRVRAAYHAVAATTVVSTEDSPAPTDTRTLARSQNPRPRRVLVAAIATLSLLTAAGAAALLTRDMSSSTTTLIARVPIAATELTPVSPPTLSELPAAPAVDFTCGAQLPYPLRIPDGYSGPAPTASSAPGQLALVWSSATGSIEARWPADPENEQPAPRSATGPNGQQLGMGMISGQIQQRADGTYNETMLILLAVLTECRTLQINIVGFDAASVEATALKMTDGGAKTPLVFPVPPLIVGSEERPTEPTVGKCNTPAGIPPTPNRGGPVSARSIHPTAVGALEAFLAADSTFLQSKYLEIKLPDGSITYANENANRPGTFLAAIHVVRMDSGWSVDHWEITGC